MKSPLIPLCHPLQTNCLCFSQWASTSMPLPSPSCVECSAPPGTASSWTDSRANLVLRVMMTSPDTRVHNMCVLLTYYNMLYTLCLFTGESEQESDLRATVLSLFLTALQCVFFSLCATIPYLPLQYLTFALQVLNRSFLFGGNAAFISVAWVSMNTVTHTQVVLLWSHLCSVFPRQEEHKDTYREGYFYKLYFCTDSPAVIK